MYYKVDFELKNFPAWSQGKRNLEQIIKKDMVQEFEDAIIELCGGYENTNNTPSDTTINDLLWHDIDTLCDYVGIDVDDFYNDYEEE